jgi:hypothetical protein
VPRFLEIDHRRGPKSLNNARTQQKECALIFNVWAEKGQIDGAQKTCNPDIGRLRQKHEIGKSSWHHMMVFLIKFLPASGRALFKPVCILQTACRTEASAKVNRQACPILPPVPLRNFEWSGAQAVQSRASKRRPCTAVESWPRGRPGLFLTALTLQLPQTMLSHFLSVATNGKDL